MTDIFISYASEDRSRIEPLAKALEDQGWSVFWDRTIPAGKTWRQVIGHALETARSVIVAWSKSSVDSSWVQEEADRGRERNILIPVLIDNVKPPLGFGAIQAADLIGWEPTQSSPEFENLISDLSVILGPSPLKVRETEQKRAEEELRHKQDEEREQGEEEQRKAEEQREQKDAKAKSKAEEEQKRKVLKAEIKPDKPEPDAITSFYPKFSEPRKPRNALKFGAMAGAIVLLTVGIWWWVFYREGRIFVESVPENATVKILNIDQDFRQGMELKPGHYNVEVAADGYKTQTQGVDLVAGHKELLRFELAKIQDRSIKLMHRGGYVAKFVVKWEQNDGKGKFVQKSWDSGKKTNPWDHTLWFQGDARDFIITGINDTGLIWDKHREKTKRYGILDGNKCVKIYGTTLNMKIEECEP